MMPARDLYALTIDAEEKEKIGLPDGLYQIVEVNEDTTSYMIEIWNGGEEHLRELLPKESYHLEKVIDVETDTLADLHTCWLSNRKDCPLTKTGKGLLKSGLFFY